MSNKADNVYLNIVITNNVSSTDPYPKNIQAVYDETLTQPILNIPSEYYASIIRFSMPLDTIPFFSFPVDRTQNNANISQLLVGVKVLAGNEFSSFVTYVPQNDTPPPTSGGPNISYTQSLSQYYFIYSIQPFINMINTALNTAFVAAGSPGGVAPFYVYDPITQLISLIVDNAFLVAGAQIFLNSYLKNYLDSFVFTTLNNIPNGAFKYFHNLTPTPYGQTSPFRYQQEYNSLDLWFDIRKIVVQSSSLPGSEEASPNYDPGESQGTNGRVSYSPIVTDFVISYNNINDVSSVLVMEPSPQYRLIDMNSNIPISRLNFSFYWLSKNGNLYPVLLSPNNSITMKIAFFKRSLYNNQ